MQEVSFGWGIGRREFPGLQEREKRSLLHMLQVGPARGPGEGVRGLGCGGPSDQCTKQASFLLSQGIPPVQQIFPDTHNFTNYHQSNLRSAQNRNKTTGSRHSCHACPWGTEAGESQVPGQPELQGKTVPSNKQTKEQPTDQTGPVQGLKASKLSHPEGRHHHIREHQSSRRAGANICPHLISTQTSGIWQQAPVTTGTQDSERGQKEDPCPCLPRPKWRAPSPKIGKEKPYQQRRKSTNR
jgi:hypothetical protein